jgi:hypothetical protein
MSGSCAWRTKSDTSWGGALISRAAPQLLSGRVVGMDAATKQCGRRQWTVLYIFPGSSQTDDTKLTAQDITNMLSRGDIK